MQIHEFQAKQLLARHGVAVPDGEIAYTATEAEAIARRFQDWPLVVKSQIHAGGRGKVGGVRIVRTLDELRDAAEQLIGRTLVTEQTGPKGKVVGKIYIEKATEIARELYISFLVDRASGGTVVVAAAEGGMEIEKLARRAPEKLIRFHVAPGVKFRSFHARKVASALGFRGQQLRAAVAFILGLAAAFAKRDALMLEINPWAVTKSGDLLALDAKMAFDPNALFRQREIEALRDVEQEHPREVEAGRHNLNYVKLDGDIGCMVNGAGLAMATLDTIALYGGRPANFMDVAGAASPERIAAALKLVNGDPDVRGILVNIFGGMMRCNSIAEGLVLASHEIGLDKPIVVRLEGTNVAEGREILAASGLPIVIAESLDEAAQRVVQLLNGKEAA